MDGTNHTEGMTMARAMTTPEKMVREACYIGSCSSYRFGIVKCFEDPVYGDEVPMIIETEREPEAGAAYFTDCWDLSTVDDLIDIADHDGLTIATPGQSDAGCDDEPEGDE